MLCDDLARLEIASNPALSKGILMPCMPCLIRWRMLSLSESLHGRKLIDEPHIPRSFCGPHAQDRRCWRLLESADVTPCCQLDGSVIMVCITVLRLHSSTASTRDSLVECTDFLERGLSQVYPWDISGLCMWCRSHEEQIMVEGLVSCFASI